MKDSLDALVRRDPSVALCVCRRDDEVNGYSYAASNRASRADQGLRLRRFRIVQARCGMITARGPEEDCNVIINLGYNTQEYAGKMLGKFEAISRNDGVQRAWDIADDCFTRVMENGRSLEQEKVLARCARRISRNPELTGLAANAAQRLALQVLAAPVVGPVGQVLAHYGLDVLENLEASLASRPDFRTRALSDQREVAAEVFREVGVARITRAEEGLVNSALNDTTDSAWHGGTDAATAVSAQREALKMLDRGVSGTREQALARFGVAFNEVSHLGVQNYCIVNGRLLDRISMGDASPATDRANQVCARAKSLLNDAADDIEYGGADAVHMDEVAGKVIDMQRSAFHAIAQGL